MTIDQLQVLRMFGFNQASTPSATPQAKQPATVAAPGDSIDAASAIRAVAARDGERSPSLFMLSTSEREKLNAGRAETFGHGWHDDAQTGALLLRANASPSYVARFLSSQHLARAEGLDAASDRKADAPLDCSIASAASRVSHAASQPRNVAQSLLAGHASLDPTAAQSDANRMIVRQKLGTALSESADPPRKRSAQRTRTTTRCRRPCVVPSTPSSIAQPTR